VFLLTVLTTSASIARNLPHLYRPSGVLRNVKGTLYKVKMCLHFGFRNLIRCLITKQRGASRVWIMLGLNEKTCDMVSIRFVGWIRLMWSGGRTSEERLPKAHTTKFLGLKRLATSYLFLSTTQVSGNLAYSKILIIDSHLKRY